MAVEICCSIPKPSDEIPVAFFRAASECGLEEILEVDEVGFDEKMNALEDHFVVKMLAQ